ncbi:MAG TPA: septal ring lytic transglycosylase RlpA family protein [Candidatus Binatia bacterium]|jgi:rare lipoprotein A
MREQSLWAVWLPALALTAGCAASTYPLNPLGPQIAAETAVAAQKPSYLEKPGGPVLADFHQKGSCSWYGSQFHGRHTSNGEVFDKNALTAAHPTLPFGSEVEVTDIESGKKVTVRINDRGPFAPGRILDLSYAAASSLDIVNKGVADVALRLVDIDDTLSTPPTAWALEVASFSNKIDANHFIEGLSADQRTAGIYYVKGPDRQAGDYRVRFGPFTCEESAKSAASKLKNVGFRPSLLREQLSRNQAATSSVLR